MKLPDKIIKHRKANGWSQEDFAEKLNVSRQAISRWENGTALPDAQNIFRISKLCGVTADYLLNEDYAGETEISAPETDAGEAQPAPPPKKHSRWVRILAVCLVVLLSGCAIAAIVKSKSEVHAHTHHDLRYVIENEVAPTCTTEGFSEIVLYCTECGKEVFRTQVSKGMPSHQFFNETCIVCGEMQRERD